MAINRSLSWKNKKRNPAYRIPNSIISYNLSATAFKVFVYIYGAFSMSGKVQIKYGTIAGKCGMSVGTAQKAMNELVDKKLINRVYRFSAHNYKLANEYVITQLSGSFTLIDKQVLKPIRDYSTFATYCALLIRKNKFGRAFPSLSQLSEDTGLSRTTVISKLTSLREQGYIVRDRYITKAGDFGHNSYTIVSTQVRLVALMILLFLANSAVNAFLFIASFFCEAKLVSPLMAISSLVNRTKNKLLPTVHRIRNYVDTKLSNIFSARSGKHRGNIFVS